MSKPRLVIVGGGWAGFYLVQYISTDQYDVTIIDPRRTFANTPLLASAAVGLFHFHLAEEPIRSRNRVDIQFFKAYVSSVDFESQTCHCEPNFDEELDSFKVEYDILVLAPGCQPNTFGTPGVEENALFMKNVSDAMALRKRLLDLFEQATLPNTSDAKVKELLHIAIVGGGPTGIELVAELDDMAKDELSKIYPRAASKLTISVYDMADNILGNYDKDLWQYANEQLAKRKINIETNSTIEKVDANHIFIKGKPTVAYGILVWATGNKESGLTESLDVRKSEKGLKRIMTDSNLRAYKDSSQVWSNVYALGDAADIDGNPLPPTADMAVQKAKYLLKVLASPSAPKAFEASNKETVSYLGSGDGVTESGGKGNAAWVAWRAGSVSWSRSLRGRIGILVSWALNSLFGTEIASV